LGENDRKSAWEALIVPFLLPFAGEEREEMMIVKESLLSLHHARIEEKADIGYQLRPFSLETGIIEVCIHPGRFLQVAQGDPQAVTFFQGRGD
jgi:hypothetical protein